MNAVLRIKRLLAATLALAVGLAPAASAQNLGDTLASFNILASPSVTLTGFAAAPMVVNRVGMSLGTTLTTTNASATNIHRNDGAAVTGQTQAQLLWDSLTNTPAVTVEALVANTFPPNLPAAGPPYTAGVIKITAAADITDGDALTITGTPNTIIIIQVGTFVTLTNMDITLAGGILPSNVYWQVNTAVTITNNAAATITVPGTFINNTAAQDITITASAAGGLNVGRFISRRGAVTVSQTAAGALLFNTPAAGPGVFFPGCTDGLFYPSPATGAVGTFSYCMASAGTVKIKVYNAIGDLASTIEDRKPAGQHTSTMNTGRLASGVYLYTLERDYGTHSVKSGVKKFAVKH